MIRLMSVSSTTKAAIKTNRAFAMSALAGRLAVVLALTFGAVTARGSLIFSEDFSTGAGGYTVDTNILGQNPTTSTGFSGAWVGANTSAYQPNASNLVMAGVANSGGSLLNQYTAFSQTRSDSRALAAYTGSDTLWVSSLMAFNSNALNNSGGSHFIGFLSGPLPGVSASGTQNATWINSNGGNLNGFAVGLNNGNLTLRYQTGSDTVASSLLTPSFTLAADTAYLMVAQLMLNTSGVNDTLNIWFLDAAVADESALGLPTLSLTTANLVDTNTDISQLVGYSAAPFSGTTGNVPSYANWDAIRMGTTFEDLSIVPEPSSAALLAGLALAAGLRSRRSRH